MTREELVALYKETVGARTEKEKADLEQQIWNVRDEGEKQQRGLFLRGLLGGSITDINARGQLYNAGALAEPLWDRVQKDLTLSMAVDLLRTAKAVGSVTKALEEYDKRPIVRNLGKGKAVRVNPPSRLPPAATLARDSNVKGAENPETARVFWTELRKLIGHYFLPRLMDAPTVEVERLQSEFETDLRILFDMFQGKIRRLQTQARGGGLSDIQRRHILEACRVLALSKVPAPGVPVDLKEARQRQRKLAALYHPDKHGGDTSMQALYDDVNRAYSVLETYNELLAEKHGS